MSAELTAVVGFCSAAAVAVLATPLAIKAAWRLGFLDRPRDYRQHAAATPFLGGAAVFVAFIVGAALIGGFGGGLLVLLWCAAGLWLLGTLDDLVAVAPKWRVLAAVGAALALHHSGLGWQTDAGGAVDIALTALWIVGLINAFNLMDNLDGACGTVLCVSAAGVGALALMRGEPHIAGLAFALAGGCLAFLRWNLARPARIFLGDGGSMSLGFLIAALAMAIARHSQAGNAGVLVGALFVGLPMLDTALVMLSRSRRGVTWVTGGRDHLTHRLLLVMRTPQRVAVALAGAQVFLCSLAIVGYELGAVVLVGVAFLAFATGVAAILVLDTVRWRPAGIATATQPRGRARRDSSLSAQVERQP